MYSLLPIRRTRGPGTVSHLWIADKVVAFCQAYPPILHAWAPDTPTTISNTVRGNYYSPVCLKMRRTHKIRSAKYAIIELIEFDITHTHTNRRINRTHAHALFGFHSYHWNIACAIWTNQSHLHSARLRILLFCAERIEKIMCKHKMYVCRNVFFFVFVIVLVFFFKLLYLAL